MGTYDYAWHDKGAETMKGVEAYITGANWWSRKGSCSGIEIRDEDGQMKFVIPYAENNLPLGYGFANCANGKTHPDQAEENADTYAYFAMAMYLSQYDWHTGFARKLSE